MSAGVVSTNLRPKFIFKRDFLLLNVLLNTRLRIEQRLMKQYKYLA